MFPLERVLGDVPVPQYMDIVCHSTGKAVQFYPILEEVVYLPLIVRDIFDRKIRFLTGQLHCQPVLGNPPKSLLFSVLVWYAHFNEKFQVVDDLSGFRVLRGKWT